MRFPLTCKIFIFATVTNACASSLDNSRARLQEGTIAYPFVDPGKRLGSNPESKRFIIRSAVGQSEYSVEIPDAGNGYDIQIPLAALTPMGTSEGLAVGAHQGKAPSPVATDKELVSSLPSLTKASASEVATMDTALGVGSPEGPVQSPSYTMGIAKVNQYYKEKNFELALMEINNVLSFYPNSPKLLKMKGTLLVKTGNHDLAMRSWQRALDLAPGDRTLMSAVRRLQDRMVAQQATKAAAPSDSLTTPIKIPAIDPEIEKLAH